MTRDRVLAAVTGAGAPIAVAEVAEALRMTPNGVRGHLRDLVRAGLITEQTEHVARRGRPRLVYTAVPQPPAVDHGTRLAALLAEAVSSGRPVREVGRASAGGPALDEGALIGAINAQGFEPQWVPGSEGRVLVLEHCPYADVAAAHTDVVCGLHRGITDALAARAGRRVVRLEVVDPAVGGCRITFAET